jgi:hypothetical protein
LQLHRYGVVMMWDAGAGSAVGRRAGHQGHCTALKWVIAGGDGGGGGGDGGDGGGGGGDASLLLSGGQDGIVKAWDPRVGGTAPVAECAAHVDAGGATSGAVGDIVQTSGGRVVTAGADGHVAVLDRRRGFERVAHLPCGDFVYSLVAAGPLALAGTGAGHLHVVDAEGVGGLIPEGGEPDDDVTVEFGEPRILYSLVGIRD